mmetsp:Transcript_56781/g.132781  ORF Transcript_56781/g.132781 Transcript_56781/m.132781 type:complete len:319 (-) Transcript_56781:137-1093(-)
MDPGYGGRYPGGATGGGRGYAYPSQQSSPLHQGRYTYQESFPPTSQPQRFETFQQSYQQSAYQESYQQPRFAAGNSISTQDVGDYNCLFKFIIIGDEAVGKTCLLLQFTDKRYRTTHQVTVGVEFGSRTVDIQGQKIKLQCWDTAGQDRFRSIIRSYYRGAQAALLVYDITRRDSFEHVMEWLREAKENADEDLVITLVGNKSDKAPERQVSYEEGYKFASRYGLAFLETSAVTGQSVDEAFLTATRQALGRLGQKQAQAHHNPMATGPQESYVQSEYLQGAQHRPGYGGQTMRLTPGGPVSTVHPSMAPVQADSCCG